MIVSSGFDDGGKGGRYQHLMVKHCYFCLCTGGDANGSTICMVAGLLGGHGGGCLVALLGFWRGVGDLVSWVDIDEP